MLTALAPFDAETILPLAEADRHARITLGDAYNEADLEDHRKSAIGWAESYTGQSLQERDFLWTVDQFRSVMRLPIGPASGAVVAYYDSDGTDTTITDTDYYLGNGSLTAALNLTWPFADGRPGGVRVTITAGYPTADDIPPHLMAAVKLAMTAFFEDRTNPDLSGAMRVADQFRAIL